MADLTLTDIIRVTVAFRNPYVSQVETELAHLSIDPSDRNLISTNLSHLWLTVGKSDYKDTKSPLRCDTKLSYLAGVWVVSEIVVDQL